MFTVQIGNEQRPLNDVDDAWINRKINERFSAGASVCVQVRIQEPNIDLLLTTPDCAIGGGAGRQANPHEAKIFQLWEQRGLRRPNYTGGDLIAFLKQVGSYL